MKRPTYKPDNYIESSPNRTSIVLTAFSLRFFKRFQHLSQETNKTTIEKT